MSAKTDEATKGSTTCDKVLDVNATDRNGDTPLHSIVVGPGNKWGSPQYNDEDDIKSIDLLLKCGIDVNAKNKDENIALHLAIIKNRAACILSKLLDANCNVNQKNKKGYIPLHLAVKTNLPFEHIKLLVDHGSDINLADKDGKTSFYYSVAPTSISCAWKSTDFKFNLVSTNITEYLIQNGAKLDVSSKTGYTPLLIGVLCRHREAVELLVKHKFDKRQFDSVVPKQQLYSTFPPTEHYGRTALQVAINDKQVEIAKMLLQAGAPTDTASKNGDTALHMAISTGQHTIVKALLQAGASVNIPTASGESCLHVATQVYDVKQSSAIAESLIENGADLNAKDKYKRTVLYMAIARERLTDR